MSSRIVLRVLSLLFAAAFSVSPALAQDSPLYVNRDARFAVIFPAQPMMREIAYTTRAGASVPARQFFVEGGAGHYAVTVVQFANGRGEDRRAVEHAAENLRRRGEVRFQAYADYDPGIPGRQLNIFETGSRQLRASIYMYDRRLYITEASADVGDVAAIQFEQSIMLLDENGDDVDREGVELVLAFIGSLFSRLLP
jgi:hypothetical protein